MWLFKPLSAHTAALSPYFAIAPYGLCVALFRYRSIRAPATAIACGNTPPRLRYCLGGNTRNWRGYVLGLAPLRAYAALSLVPLHPRPRMLSSCSMLCMAGDIGGGRRVAPPHRRGKKIPQSILQLKMKRCHKLNRRLKLVMGVTFLYRVFSIVILVKYIKCNLILKINFQFQRQ